MQVQVEVLSSVQKKLNFVVDRARVDTAMDKAYKTLGREARLPGFRPGHIPRRILEQRFGRQIEGEVGSQLIGEAFDQAVKAHAIEPVSQPIVQNASLKAGTDFTFAVIVEVKPQVHVEGWEGLDVEWERVEIADEAVEAEVERLRKQHSTASSADPDHAAVAGDEVTVSGTVSAEGKDSVTVTDLSVVAGGPNADAMGTWIGSLVEGLVVGTEKTVAAAVSGGAFGPAWDGVEASVTLSASAIKVRTVPALDDEFARDNDFESMDMLRANIRFKQEEHMREHVRTHAARFAIDKLIAKTPIDVPPGLARQEAENLLQQQRQYYAMRGLRLPKARLDQLKEEARNRLLAEAIFSVRRALILQDVARQANLKLDDAEFDARIEKIAEELGQQPSALKGLLKKNEGTDELKTRLLEEKALDLVLERANIIDTDPRDHDHEGDDFGEGELAEASAIGEAGHGHEHSHEHAHDHGHSHDHGHDHQH